jgi:hypothetical protein
MTFLKLPIATSPLMGDIMHSQFPIRIAAMFILMAAGATQVAPAWEDSHIATLTLVGGITQVTPRGRGHLASLTARQQLRDEVCIAMADGRISRLERYVILANARRVLRPEEYLAFTQSLDRLPSSTPAAVRHPVKVAQDSAQTQPPTTAPDEAPSPPDETPLPPVEASAVPDPTDIAPLDRVASTDRAR